jgi:hypothetical protein
LVGEEGSVVVQTDHKAAFETAILVLREQLDRALYFELAQSFDLEKFDANPHIIFAAAAKAG